LIPELKNGTGWIRVERSGVVTASTLTVTRWHGTGQNGTGACLRVGVNGVGGERGEEIEGVVQAVAFSHARLHITVDNPHTTDTATALRVIYVLYNITVNLTISLDVLSFRVVCIICKKSNHCLSAFLCFKLP
jgi:hypothetical protein